MIRLRHSLLCLSLCLACTAGASETMPPHVAAKLGLEVAWQRQLSVPAAAQSIVDQQIYVHVENPREYVEVVGTAKAPKAGEKAPTTKPAAAATETVFARIPTDQVGRTGVEIGRTEAERLAKNEIRRLEYRGFTAKLATREVPRIRLYTLANDGTVDCRDAESGEPIWMARVGDRRLGYGHLGINNEHVSVINGGNLIKIDCANGEEIETIRTTSPPLYGAIHSGKYSVIATIRSGVEVYPLFDTTDPPFMEIVAGIALAPPAKSPTSSRLAWGTSKGFVYVLESAGKPSVLFRLNTDGIVKGRIAPATGNRFFFGSSNGQAYGILADTNVGSVMWSKPYGEPFYHSPLVIDDQVLMRSTYGNLYSLHTDNGIMTWEATVPNVDELLGAFDGQLYVRLLSGGLSVIDLKTGKTIRRINELQPRRLLVNTQTDRLYLVGKTGAVQCLRPIDATLPTFNKSNLRTPDVDPDAEASVEEEPTGPTPMAPEPAGGDPFAAGADNGADPFAAGGADPFGAADGAGADPFGGGGEMADPFGADAAPAGNGADPFSDPFGG